MTFLDAYAVVALILDELAAADVELALREGDCRIVIVNLAEAVDVSQRVHGYPRDVVRDAIETLIEGDVLKPAVSREEDAWLAAELRSRYYDKQTASLSVADCFLLAHALATSGRIVTADAPVARAARSEGVEVVGLPDSRGRRP